jgi:hypothetical protein
VGGVVNGQAAQVDGALVLGWHHSTRSVAAHCFENDRPLCQDSDPGEIVDRLNPGRLLGRICEDCRAVYKSRILHAIARSKGHVTGGSASEPDSAPATSEHYQKGGAT